MISLYQQAADYLKAGQMNEIIGLHLFIDDQVFLTKCGELGVVIHFPGIDFEGREPAQLDAIARRFEAAVRTFTEDHRIYQYLIKTHTPLPTPADHPNEVVNAAIHNRIEFFQAKADKLYTVEIYFVLTAPAWAKTKPLERFKRDPLGAVSAWFSGTNAFHVLHSDLAVARAALANKAHSFVAATEDLFHPTILDKREAFRFFRRLLNYDPNKHTHAQLPGDHPLDFYVCDSTLQCYSDHLKQDSYYVDVLVVKQPPSTTFANTLNDLLRIPSEAIICSEFRRQDNGTTAKHVRSQQRHFHNSKSSMLGTAMAGDSANQPGAVIVDASAVALVSDLGECLTEMEVRNNYFGEFSLTVIVYNKDRRQLNAAIADVYKVFQTKDALLFQESHTWNLLNAYLAVIPGNTAYNLRRFLITGTNYADLSMIFTIATGERLNDHLKTEYLALFETNHETLYYFNLHHKDVAHTLVLGATGSGKSFLLNFLITNLQKYNPFTVIFDLGGSYKHLTGLFGGTYSKVSVEHRAFEINPFSLPLTPENHEFIFAFVRVLLEGDGGGALSVAESKELFEQIRVMAQIEPEHRRLQTLSRILPKRLDSRLARWVEGGQYGSLFDNVHDTLSFAKFQCFDFEGLDKYPLILEPLLFYILHRANETIYDPALATTFKVFVMDEAWRFFSNKTIRDYLREALKTWRKRNAAMILATQSGDDLRQSEILPLVLESCPTRIFLANPGMDADLYRTQFQLNATQLDIIRTLTPKRKLFLHTPTVSKELALEVDPKSYWLFTNSPLDNARRDALFQQYGLTRALEILSTGQDKQASSHV
jgi:type IV secretion system protein TrbE